MTDLYTQHDAASHRDYALNPAPAQQDILTVGAPLPATLGGCADLLHDVSELRIAMNKQVEAIKAREAEIEEHLIATFDETKGNTGASGQRYRAELMVESKVKINDWGVFTSYVRKNDLFTLLQKRLSEKAVEEQMTAENRLLPGLEKFRHKWISVTKRR